MELIFIWGAAQACEPKPKNRIPNAASIKYDFTLVFVSAALDALVAAMGPLDVIKHVLRMKIPPRSKFSFDKAGL